MNDLLGCMKKKRNVPSSIRLCVWEGKSVSLGGPLMVSKHILK